MYADIGQKLRQARQAQALSVEQASRATRIRVHYLQAIERGDLDALPSSARARGFLRLYANFLGLDAGEMLEGCKRRASSSKRLVPRVRKWSGHRSGRAAGMQIPVPGFGTAVPYPEPLQELPQSELPTAAQEIFAEVGQKLCHQRELLGLSLDDVARHTHLRRHYLQALEEGNLSGLPSPVQGRGMLKNYAVFLGMDAEALLLRFADGLQARLAVRQVARQPAAKGTTPSSRPLPAPLRRLFSVDVLAGVGLVAFLAFFAVWGAIRIFNLRSQSVVSPTAPSIAAVLLAAPTDTPALKLELATPTPATGGRPASQFGAHSAAVRHSANPFGRQPAGTGLHYRQPARLDAGYCGRQNGVRRTGNSGKRLFVCRKGCHRGINREWRGPAGLF